jgi:predicted outer membrane protein
MVPLLLTFVLGTARERSGDETSPWNAMHLVSQAAIEAGSLAQQRATSPEIRNLGRLMVRDNSAFDRRLSALATARGIQLAEGPKPARIQFEELRGSHGVEFDRKFLNFGYAAAELLRKHMRDGAAQSGDASLRDLIAIFDPIIQQDEFLSGWCLGHCVSKSP